MQETQDSIPPAAPDYPNNSDSSPELFLLIMPYSALTEQAQPVSSFPLPNPT
jgi:hypothetical protein